MEPPQKKQYDHLLDFPAELKAKILSYLKLKYAMRTSFLCKSWRKSWMTLAVMTINRCHFRLPKDFEGFFFLKRLSLFGVKISNRDFEKMVSNSPELESLVLQGMRYGWSLDLIIQRPNLKKIRIITEFRSLKIEAPKLLEFDHVNNDDEIPIWENEENFNGRNFFTGALGHMPEVERMSLGSYFLTYLSQSVPLQQAHFNFLQLKELKLEIGFDDHRVAAIILALLEKSPNLEKFVITMLFPEFAAHHPINFWGSLNLGNYVFHRLRLVTFDRFEFITTNITLSFFEMILACSPNLEKLHIQKGNMDDDDEIDEQMVYVAQLQNLPKASVNAEVAFLFYEDED